MIALGTGFPPPATPDGRAARRPTAVRHRLRPGFASRSLALAGAAPAAGRRRATARTARVAAPRSAPPGSRVADDRFRVPGLGRSRNVIGALRDRPPTACDPRHGPRRHRPAVAGRRGQRLGRRHARRARAAGLAAPPRCDVWLVATGAEERIYTGQPDHLGRERRCAAACGARPRQDLRWALSLDEVGRGRAMWLRSPARRRFERASRPRQAARVSVRWVPTPARATPTIASSSSPGSPRRSSACPDNPLRHTAADVAGPPAAGDSCVTARARALGRSWAQLRREAYLCVPEGDTIHYAANRIRPVLDGHVPDEIRTPHPRFGRDRWPERLAGRGPERRRPRQAPLPALRGRPRDPRTCA